MKQITIIIFLFFNSSIVGQPSKNLENLQRLEVQNKQISDSILQIQVQNNRIQAELRKQSNKINQQTSLINNLIVSSKKSEFNWMKDLIYPFPLSILSAIVFWLFFSVYPEKKRRKNIRKKIDLDMYFVLRRMFGIFDTIMRHNNHSPSHFQDKINGNKLNLDDIRLGLKNKCKNDSYFYYPEINPVLMEIGKDLFQDAQKIDLLIERIFNFDSYLSTNEVLIMESIKKKLQVYDLENFSQSAFTEINGIQLKPVDPSLSYMAQNIYELYELYIEFQKIIFNNKNIDRDISINKVQHYFYSGQFQNCLKEIQKSKNKYPKDSQFIDLYLFRCLYATGKTKKALTHLEKILSKKPNLVSSRSFISEYLNDIEIEKLIKICYSEKEIEEFKSVVEEENLTLKFFIDNATVLSNFYEEKKKKSTATPAGNTC